MRVKISACQPRSPSLRFVRNIESRVSDINKIRLFSSAPIQHFYDSQTIPILRFVRLSSNNTGKTYRKYLKK